MVNLNNKYLFVKGTCNVNVSDIANGDVVYQSSKVATDNLTTEVTLDPIRGGLGNPIAIQLPSDAGVAIELTTVDFSMESRAMQVGTQLAYNAIRPVCVAVTAEDATLSLPEGAEPVANYGYDTAYAYVNYAGAENAGIAYAIGENNLIEGFAAVAGQTYNVTYFERQANAQELAISSNFAPGIYHVSVQLPVYSTEGGNAANRGSQVGWLYVYIPRMQFSGNASISGSQTEAANSVMSGTALSYEEANNEGACTDCTFPMLAYVVYVPFSTSGNGLTGLVVIGGGVTVAANASVVLPVKYVMADGTLVQPSYNKLTYVSAAEATATVANGVVTGVAAGSTTVTITSQDDETISTTATVTVTA